MRKGKELPYFDDADIEQTVGHTISEEQGEEIRAALHPYRQLLAGHLDGTAGPRTTPSISRGHANGRLLKTGLPAQACEKLLGWAEGQRESDLIVRPKVVSKQKDLPHFDDIDIERAVNHTISDWQGEQIRAALRPYRELLADHQAGTPAPRTSLVLSRGRANGRLVKAHLSVEDCGKLLTWAEHEHPQPATTRHPAP